jgi:hypothetical protein
MRRRLWSWAALALVAGCGAPGSSGGGDARDGAAASDARPRDAAPDARPADGALADGALADATAADAAPDAAHVPVDAASKDGAPTDAGLSPVAASGLCAGCGVTRSARYLLIGAAAPVEPAGPAMISPRYRLEPGLLPLVAPGPEDAR